MTVPKRNSLRYIKIPLETFPTHLLNDDAAVMECIETIESLTSMKIVNLTGWSNTDLKLEYGTANINDLYTAVDIIVSVCMQKAGVTSPAITIRLKQ